MTARKRGAINTEQRKNFSYKIQYVYVEIINNLPLRTLNLNYRIREWSIDSKSPATPLHSGSWVGELVV